MAFLGHLLIIGAGLVGLVLLIVAPRRTVAAVATLGCGYIGSENGFLGTCAGLAVGAVMGGVLAGVVSLVLKIPRALEASDELWKTARGRLVLGGYWGIATSAVWALGWIAYASRVLPDPERMWPLVIAYVFGGFAFLMGSACAVAGGWLWMRSPRDISPPSAALQSAAPPVRHDDQREEKSGRQ